MILKTTNLFTDKKYYSDSFEVLSSDTNNESTQKDEIMATFDTLVEETMSSKLPNNKFLLDDLDFSSTSSITDSSTNFEAEISAMPTTDNEFTQDETNITTSEKNDNSDVLKLKNSESK